MAQLVARLDDTLLEAVDELVATGVTSSRSEAVRLALEQLVERHRRQRTGDAIVAAYRRQPQTADELASLPDATRAIVDEDPW